MLFNTGAIERWFVSADGNGNGSREDPWGLADLSGAALGSVNPGARIYLYDTGGDYKTETGLTLNFEGTADEPITIRNFPGHAPRLDGAIRAFVDSPATAWEPVSVGPGHNVYRSTATYPTVAGAWYYGGHIEIDGELWPLAIHKDGPNSSYTTDDGTFALSRNSAYLESDVHVRVKNGVSRYLGPGIAWNSLDSRIYIRLDPSSSLAQCGRAVKQVADLDPRNQPIYISRGERYGITVGGSHLIIPGLQIDNYYGITRFAGVDEIDVEFNNIKSAAFQYLGHRSGGANSDIRYNNCELDGRMVSEDWWVAFSDIKGDEQVADHNRKSAFSVSATELVTINGGHYNNCFDGFIGEAHDVEFGGRVVFEHMWDDLNQNIASNTHINFGGGVRTELGVFCWGAGPSEDDSGSSIENPDAETNYFHDFVVDTTRHSVFEGRWGRDDFIGEFESIPHNRHGGHTDSAHWDQPRRFYNFTVITGGPVRPSAHVNPVYSLDGLTIVSAGRVQSHTSSYVGLSLFGSPANLSAGVHHVKNGIMKVLDSRPLARDLYPDGGREEWDGNLYFGWSSGVTQSNYHGVASFVHLAGGVTNVAATVAPYINTAAGIYAATTGCPVPWEQHGVTMDPALDPDTLLPSAAGVHTGAVDLSGTGWPGTDDYVPKRGCRVPAVT